MSGNYVIKEKNIKSIIAYILMGVVVTFYEYYMFNHYPVIAYITSGITLLSLSIFLMEYMRKEGLFLINIINYIVVPIIYWLYRFIYHLCDGKSAGSIILGFIVAIFLIFFFLGFVYWVISLFLD